MKHAGSMQAKKSRSGLDHLYGWWEPKFFFGNVLSFEIHVDLSDHQVANIGLEVVGNLERFYTFYVPHFLRNYSQC